MSSSRGPNFVNTEVRFSSKAMSVVENFKELKYSRVFMESETLEKLSNKNVSVFLFCSILKSTVSVVNRLYIRKL